MHAHIHRNTYTYVDTHTQRDIHAHSLIHTHAHGNTHVDKDTRKHAHVHACIRMLLLSLDMRTGACVLPAGGSLRVKHPLGNQRPQWLL